MGTANSSEHKMRRSVPPKYNPITTHAVKTTPNAPSTRALGATILNSSWAPSIAAIRTKPNHAIGGPKNSRPNRTGRATMLVRTRTTRLLCATAFDYQSWSRRTSPSKKSQFRLLPHDSRCWSFGRARQVSGPPVRRVRPVSLRPRQGEAKPRRRDKVVQPSPVPPTRQGSVDRRNGPGRGRFVLCHRFTTDSVHGRFGWLARRANGSVRASRGLALGRERRFLLGSVLGAATALPWCGAIGRQTRSVSRTDSS